MRLFVDPERCQGHTLCNRADPELFLLDESGYCALPPEGQPVPEGAEGRARRGMAMCPERALRLEPGPSGA
jgi:ferredoxin